MTTIIGVGRRKTATARAYIKEGTGKIQVNKKEPLAYFGQQVVVDDIVKPLFVASMENKFDIVINVTGGGAKGQAGAAKLAIARALIKFLPDLKNTLKQQKLLTRDPRMKERKKYGLKKARKAYQFSKR